jgi:hypothetical protein
MVIGRIKVWNFLTTTQYEMQCVFKHTASQTVTHL